MHDLKADRKRLTECVVRAFRHSPELANFQRGTYQDATIANFCTDLPCWLPSPSGSGMR